MEKRSRYISVIGVICVLIAFFVAALSLIFATDFANQVLTLTMLMIAGMMMRSFFIGTPKGTDTMFRSDILFRNIILMIVGVVLIKLVAIFSFSLSVALATGGLVILGLAAITESWFVHGGVQSTVKELTGSTWIAIFSSAGLACLMHFFVYGASGQTLLYVFGAFLVLSATYAYSGERIEVPIIIHLIINFGFLFGL